MAFDWRSGVSRETSQRIDHFAALLETWSKKTNLVSAGDRDRLFERHIADSVQLSLLAPEPLVWADLGSGGGFPGVITAILLAEKQGGWVHLVESNKKKAAFLRIALLETHARGSVHTVRIEDAHAKTGRCDAISARALADLDQLLAYCAPWFADNPDCVAWFHKGRDYRREVEHARGSWAFDLVEHRSKIDAESMILRISQLESQRHVEP